MNISHGENTEAQKGHRAAPDFSILAAWRHQGKVASKIESYQKMKRYRENQEAAGNQATAEKPGRVPPPPLQKERCAISRGLAAEGLCYQGATPPRGYAAEGAVPPRGYAAKRLCRQGLLSPKRSAAKGGNQARYLLPRTRTAPARAATVMRLSHRPIAAPSAVLGLSVP